jgi:hypothetical protein
MSTSKVALRRIQRRLNQPKHFKLPHGRLTIPLPPLPSPLPPPRQPLELRVQRSRNSSTSSRTTILPSSPALKSLSFSTTKPPVMPPPTNALAYPVISQENEERTQATEGYGQDVVYGKVERWLRVSGGSVDV